MKQIILLLLINALFLSSCALKKLPQGKDNVKSVYENFSKNKTSLHINSHVNLSDYTAEKNQQIKGLFKTLDNPELLIYVYPHITNGGLPVPGYLTQIKMFEIDHYALPGEKIEIKR